jgi:hypothetical protein
MTPQRAHIAAAGNQGLGFVTLDLEAPGVTHRVVWHNGGLQGWKAAWYVVPDARAAIVMLATRMEAPLDQLARELLPQVLA